MMSRTKPVIARRVSEPTRATVNSNWKSVPSVRTPVNSSCRPSSGPRPVCRYWPSASSCLGPAVGMHQDVDATAEDLAAPVPEHLFGGRIEFPDGQVRIHRDDGVVRGLEDGALPGLGLEARAVHLVGQVQRRGRQEECEPVSRAFGHRQHDRRGGGAEDVARHVRHEVLPPDPPRALVGCQADRDRNGHRVHEEIREGHPGQRPRQRDQIECRRRAAEPCVHLTRRFSRQDEDRDVEQRAIERVPVGGRLVERRLGQAAGGADNHPGVRPAQDERGDVHDVQTRTCSSRWRSESGP